jgi:rhodanese-related sulfurtransferase
MLHLIEFISNHFILCALFVALLTLLIMHELRRGGQSLSTRELTALVNGGNALVLDVRAKKDFDGGHIVDSLNIPYEKLASRLAELEKHRGKTIIVVDSIGQHAGTASLELKKAGFEVAKLSGGITSWRGDNLPVVK